MSDDLLKRLRAYNDESFVETLCGEAAERIETLQASNLRLSGMCHDMTAELARLQAQVRFFERKALD